MSESPETRQQVQPEGTTIPHLKPFNDVPHLPDLRALLDYMAESYGEDAVYIIKTKKETKTEPAQYRHVSFLQQRRDVDALGTVTLAAGVKGKRVAVIGKNRYEWMLTYYTTQCGLGIVVPLDKGLPYEELELSLIRAKADILVFDPEQLDLVEELQRNRRTQVELYVSMDPIPGYADFQEVLQRGHKMLDEIEEKEGKGNAPFQKLRIDGKELSLLLFTSGTTSLAKAVMLSQYNITTNVWSVLCSEDLRHGDVNMAFLPYHHTFGSTGQCMMSGCGMTTVFCDGLKYVQKNMVEYKVSVFICVPLLIEAIYKKIMAGIKKEGKEATFSKGLKISGILGKLHIDVRRRLFKDILDQLGGSLRYIISGASPLDPEVADGFRKIGINVVQGYGLTETSPVLSAENPYHQRWGSIGLAVPGVDLMVIDRDEEGVGELIARGDSIMLGYYEDPEATAEVMMGDWFRTGDLVSADKDGYLTVRGRAKNVIVLKNGKNIYPEEVELLISNLPYVEEVMVYGEPRHKDGDHKDLALAARIVCNEDYMRDIFGAEKEEDMEVIVKKDIDLMNDTLPSYKKILRFTATTEPMEKTTTGKVKRYKQRH